MVGWSKCVRGFTSPALLNRLRTWDALDKELTVMAGFNANHDH